MTPMEKLKAGWKPFSDGQPVEKLTDFGPFVHTPFSLTGAVNGVLLSWTKEGFYTDNSKNPNDLTFLPPTETLYLNVYALNNGSKHMLVYNSEAEAIEGADTCKVHGIEPIAIAQPFTFTPKQQE